MKSNARIFVLCDKHIYRLTSDYQLAKKGTIELDMITGLSISSANDQTLVIHCVVRECMTFIATSRFSVLTSSSFERACLVYYDGV